MKELLLAIALLFVFIVPVYAESANEICTQELRDAGIVDQDEIDLYMKECIEQVTAEKEADESEMQKDVEAPVAEES